ALTWRIDGTGDVADNSGLLSHGSPNVVSSDNTGGYAVPTRGRSRNAATSSSRFAQIRETSDADIRAECFHQVVGASPHKSPAVASSFESGGLVRLESVDFPRIEERNYATDRESLEVLAGSVLVERFCRLVAFDEDDGPV